jgi:hypothetical protein
MTTAAVEEYKVILSVGDTTFLDYRNIKGKREGYGPTGQGERILCEQNLKEIVLVPTST